MIGSGSELERLLECPSSAVLPRAKDDGSEYADRGQAIHQFLEAASAVGREEALAHVPEEYVEVCELVDVDALPAHLSTEVAFTYDTATGTALCLGSLAEPRNYGEPPATALAVTVDLVGLSDDAVYVGDYKTGHGEVAPAAANPQLLLGALCAAQVYDKHKAVVEIIKLRDPGNPWRDTAEFDVFDLSDFASALRALAERVEQSRHDIEAHLVEGPHCRYCPCYEYCPAKRALARRVADESLPEEVELRWAGDLTEQIAPEAWRQWQAIKQLEKRMSSILHAFGKEHSFSTRPGYTFGAHEKKSNERLDGDVAWKEIERMYGMDIADAAVKRSATKDGIEKALRQVEDDDSLAARKRTVLKAIREEGGGKRTKSTKVEEYANE